MATSSVVQPYLSLPLPSFFYPLHDREHDDQRQAHCHPPPARFLHQSVCPLQPPVLHKSWRPADSTGPHIQSPPDPHAHRHPPTFAVRGNPPLLPGEAPCPKSHLGPRLADC